MSLAHSAPAHAEITLTATGETDYRLRGVSLTNGKPNLRIGLSYDHGGGLYGGAAVILGDRAQGGFHALGHLAYVGYAVRRADGLTLDLGAVNSRIVNDIKFHLTTPAPPPYYVVTQVRFHRYRAEYTEGYVGLTKGDLSAYLYLSPDYLTSGARTAYLDLNAAVRPADRVRLFAHAGMLAYIGGPTPPRTRDTRFDLRAGAALELDHGELQLAWTGVSPQTEYPVGYPQDRSAVVLSASVFF